jgi:hypothetical protein
MKSRTISKIIRMTPEEKRRLEYCAEAIKQCGLTADDIWFPSMSTRRSRPIVIYNRFE